MMQEIIELFHRGETKITPKIKEYLSVIPSFKEAIDAYSEKELYLIDCGRHYSCDWCIGYIKFTDIGDGKGYTTQTRVSEVEYSTNDLIDKIAEVFCPSEIKRKPNKIDDEGNFNFGKYKGKSISFVKSIDSQYFSWCLCNVKGFEKEFLKIN